MRGLLKPLLPLVAAILLLPGVAYAQVGSIAGIVRDSSGGVVPGVNVEVTSPALIEKVRATVTDSNGRYQIPALPVGTYTITFTLSGFSVVKRENIQLTSDFTAPVNAEMAVGNLAETVSVVAEAPSVDVQNARVQHVFQGEEVGNLPTERDLAGLMNLVPALTPTPGTGICNGGIGIFCNPLAPAFNSHVSGADTDGLNQGRIMVDGMSINRGGSGQGINLNSGITNGISIDTANVQEVSFTLSGALGESETGGASINIVPKTGGNRYTGEYFSSYTGTRFFDRNRKTHLSNTPDTQEYIMDYDVNGAFGGPILRDRFWFYLQGRKRADEQYPNGGTVPGFANLNEGKFAANYVPDRSRGWLTFGNEYKNANIRLTLQASQRNKINIFWDEQDACTNPCHGMINIVDSPEAYFTLQQRPNRLQQISWTNPFTNRMLFEAGLSVVATHNDTTRHRDFPNYRSIPRVCESGATAGRDSVDIKVNQTITNATNNGLGNCNVFNTMISGSINDSFPGAVPNTLTNDDTYRSRASASYVTGSHNAKIGFEGAYFGEKIRNEVNDLRLSYRYLTPDATCVDQRATNPYACGNMTLYYADSDPFNLNLMRPRPVAFEMSTGVGVTDERVWFGALYVQDQWTLDRFTINGALRYDHAESGYGETCIGPDKFVPIQVNGDNFWCSTPTKGVRFNDITPRWGLAWDLFGDGKTSIKWNMGKYLQAAGFGGIYTDNNPARRSTNQLNRGWDDVNGNRIVECDFANPAPHTHPSGDICGSMLQTTGANAGLPTTQFLQFGRPPNATQLANPDSFCGRTENSSDLHRRYCDAAGQNLMAGWGKRRSEWQFGLGIQHELLPRLSGEVTYNYRKYQNLTDDDTLGRGCDYFLGADPQACFDNLQNYRSVNYDFYSVRAPMDPRLPDGGGYLIKGLINQNIQGNLPDLGDVTVIRKELEYSWNGVDTNFVYRGRGGLRISGGTSTGRSQRNTCNTDGDTPTVKGREGNEYRGAVGAQGVAVGCIFNNPFTTNVRANASYTIPWVDVLLGVVYQSRPGGAIQANWNVPFALAVWEPASANRANSGGFFGNATTVNATQTINLLDVGDLYLERISLWDLNLQKNIRFAGKRVNFGLQIYNFLNSDAITTVTQTYTATRLPNGTWQADDPATPAVEVNNWGNVTQIVNPRFARVSVAVHF
jgi:hypothetical protein